MKAFLYILFLFGFTIFLVWYFFSVMPKAVDQGVKDFKAWRQKPDTTITIKNGRADTTITIKK